jgi:HSP20 family molecular chaperone IbpA
MIVVVAAVVVVVVVVAVIVPVQLAEEARKHFVEVRRLREEVAAANSARVIAEDQLLHIDLQRLQAQEQARIEAAQVC